MKDNLIQGKCGGDMLSSASKSKSPSCAYVAILCSGHELVWDVQIPKRSYCFNETPFTVKDEEKEDHIRVMY